MIEVENDNGIKLTLLALSISLVVSIGVFFVFRIEAAVLACVATYIIIVQGWASLSSVRIPRVVKDFSSIAVSEYQMLHPESEVRNVAVRLIEKDYYIYSVRHDLGRPIPRTYMKVSADGKSVEEVENQKRYWPKGLK